MLGVSGSRLRGGLLARLSPSLLDHAQANARAHLLSAVACERAMRWAEVVEHYTALLRTLSREELPKDFEPGFRYLQLLFETYYHLAVAFQKQNQHKEAVEAFTKAIEIGLIPKGVCQVGCTSKSFLQTPVFARRAYAHVKCGNMKEAIVDANRAVELDPSNPDVYCVRALVWSAAKEKNRAITDLNSSLKLKSSHTCALIIRGAITNSLMAKKCMKSIENNKDHKKALDLSKDSQQFFDVEDFLSPKMADFYDKFLWSLTVSHTVMEVNLLPGSLTSSRLTSYLSNRGKEIESFRHRTLGSFNCGTLITYPDNTSFLRRTSYAKMLKEMDSMAAKSDDSKISERILRLTKAASEWSENQESHSSLKKRPNMAAAEEAATAEAASKSIVLACKKNPKPNKYEASKNKVKKQYVFDVPGIVHPSKMKGKKKNNR